MKSVESKWNVTVEAHKTHGYSATILVKVSGLIAAYVAFGETPLEAVEKAMKEIRGRQRRHSMGRVPDAVKVAKVLRTKPYVPRA